MRATLIRFDHADIGSLQRVNINGTATQPVCFNRCFETDLGSPNDPCFAKRLKTDFLWSIALKNVAP